MINPNGIKANEKPMSEDLSFVYAEDSNKDFVRVSKEVLKLLLGVATKLSELDNDENFINNMVDDLKNYYLKSETYTREEIDDKLSLVPRFSVKVVTTLPTEGISDTTVYLVPSNEDEENLYTEYINVNGLWEILGAQKIAKFEVTKEDIEFALGYVPADNEKILQIENDVKDKLSETELSLAIEEALRQAKASGEFKGDKGDKGDKGKTPQKGTDYFTEADKQELVTNVLNALPTWTGGAY